MGTLRGSPPPNRMSGTAGRLLELTTFNQRKKMSEKTQFDEWALVELFGHQKIVGRVSEATLAGGAFLRVDVPAVDEHKAFTRFYGPGAIYSINPVTEEIAKGLLER